MVPETKTSSRRATAGLALAVFALVTSWLPAVAVPAGVGAVLFGASARAEAHRAQVVVPRVASAALALAAVAIAVGVAISIAALASS